MTARRTWLGISPPRCLKDSDAPHFLSWLCAFRYH
jgi:hypothetical protein